MNVDLITLKTLESSCCMLLCRYGHQAKIVHFLGRNKPWHGPSEQQTSTEVPQWDSNRNLEKYVNLWWAEYYSPTTTHTDELHELQDSEPTEHLSMLVDTPCSTHETTSPDVRLQSCVSVNQFKFQERFKCLHCLTSDYTKHSLRS